jgi:hypothetical protein
MSRRIIERNAGKNIFLFSDEGCMRLQAAQAILLLLESGM